MEDMISQLISAGAAGIMLAAFGLFLRFLAQEREHREVMAKWCHEHHAQEAERNRTILSRSIEQSSENSRVLGQVSIHLEQCASATRDLEQTMRMRANGG